MLFKLFYELGQIKKNHMNVSGQKEVKKKKGGVPCAWGHVIHYSCEHANMGDREKDCV